MIDGFQGAASWPLPRLNSAGVAESPASGSQNDLQFSYGGGTPSVPSYPGLPSIPPTPRVPRSGGGYGPGFGGGFPDFPRFPGFPPGFPGFFPGGRIPRFDQFFNPVNGPGTQPAPQPGVTPAPQPTGSGPNVLVIDQTSLATAGIDLDGDGRSDRAHGTIVSDFIRSGLPNANVSNLEIPDYEPATLTNLFNNVSSRIDGGERFNAINFSQQTFHNFNELAQVTGLPVNQQNIGQMKDQVRDRLFMLAQNPGATGQPRELVEKFTRWVPVIQSMDQMAARGVPLYVAAGNDGPNQINLFTLAQGARVVGALDANGRFADYSANNSLINETELGNNPIVALSNRAGQIVGVDFTGDRRVDAGVNELSGGGRNIDTSRQVTGTSFAAPRALADDLSRQFGIANARLMA